MFGLHDAGFFPGSNLVAPLIKAFPFHLIFCMKACNAVFRMYEA